MGARTERTVARGGVAKPILLTAMVVTGVAMTARAESGALEIESGAFGNQAAIPAKHTCEGVDVAPPLAWSGVPSDAETLVLIVDDPDAPDPAAPRRTWVHWVLYDIPAGSTGIDEGGALPKGTRHGVNDWRKTGYRGPCPPIGRHRYFFKLYAIDTAFGDLGTPAKADVEHVMKGHIVAETTLVGTYQKKR